MEIEESGEFRLSFVQQDYIIIQSIAFWLISVQTGKLE